MLVPLVVKVDISNGSMALEVAVQLKVTPGVVLLKFTRLVVLPEQIVCDAGEKVTDGDGFTVTVKLKVLVQLFGAVPDEAVILYTTSIGDVVVLVKFPVIDG